MGETSVMYSEAQIPYVNFPNPEGFDGFGFDWSTVPVIGGLLSKALGVGPSQPTAYDYLNQNLSAIKANEDQARIVSEVVMAVGVGLLIIGLMK